ncbi:MAG: hypothetical protein KBC11_01115 [Candidatus Pacebacteria bacterium]|nr:hypothetical protein [Candidatus Paceibacterota bacterium]
MKKIFLIFVIVLGTFTSVKAQEHKITFVPEVFSPVALNQQGEATAYGTAYLEEVPVGFSKMLTAYYYMPSADGKSLLKLTIAGEMYPLPSHWPDTFFRNYNEKTLMYNAPKPVKFRIDFTEGGTQQRVTFIGL